MIVTDGIEPSAAELQLTSKRNRPKESEMSPSELSQHRQRLQRKLAASFQGWHSGRVDRLEEALRAIERELDRTRSAGSVAAQHSKHH
jgi:hypothetical protein